VGNQRDEGAGVEREADGFEPAGQFGAGLGPELPGTADPSASRFSSGAFGVAPPIHEPTGSTPLQDHESQGDVPAAPLWAMKDRQHARHGGGDRIRARLGTDGETLYVIDDGATHCMIGRIVGSTPDRCTYCLVARIPVDRYRRLVDGEIPLREAFSDARDIALCGVIEQARASNVFLVQHYRHIEQVPDQYLPPSPLIEFADDLSTDE
jgi:hypothetical protein